jgi:hypothetical protein
MGGRFDPESLAGFDRNTHGATARENWRGFQSFVP